MKRFFSQGTAGSRKGSSNTLCAVAVILAAAGCVVTKREGVPPFDQRVFRSPPSAGEPLLSSMPFGRYGELFEKMSARLGYFVTAGTAASPQDEPLFMLEGESAGQIRTRLRTVRDGHTLFLCNVSANETLVAALHLSDYSARIALLNPANGKAFVLRQEEDGSYRIAFAPGQIWCVCFGELARKFVFDGIYGVPHPRRVFARLGGVWHGKRRDPNALMLESPRRSHDGGKPRLRYTATVTDVPAVCRLALNQPGAETDVRVNGQAVTLSTNDVYLSKAFQTCDVAALLRQGENEIEVVLDGETPTQNICLVGDFALKVEPGPQRHSIVKESPPALGDLAPQGYPFYAGTFALETTVELPSLTHGTRYLLTFPGFAAAVLHVTVNGVIFDPLFISPWETDISVALRPGLNRVRVELTNRLDAFNTPFGLLAPPVIVEQCR